MLNGFESWHCESKAIHRFGDVGAVRVQILVYLLSVGVNYAGGFRLDFFL